jgi:hypothetical protein
MLDLFTTIRWLHIILSNYVVLNCGSGCCDAQCGRCSVKLSWIFTNYIKWHHYVAIFFTLHCRVLVYSINTDSKVLEINGWVSFFIFFNKCSKTHVSFFFLVKLCWIKFTLQLRCLPQKWLFWYIVFPSPLKLICESILISSLFNKTILILVKRE